MAPRVILIRHAQALHNVDNNIHDPPLSDLGAEQCVALRQSLRDRLDGPSLNPSEIAIIASPMRRTLQTAQLATDWLTERGVKIVADASWQENSAKPCDTGSPITAMKAEFPDVDFETVDPVWPDKTTPAGGRYAYTRTAILARGKRCIEELSHRPEKLVLVISHSGFLRVGMTGYWWMNADYRIFDFEHAASGELRLRQDESTLSGGLGLSWKDPVELGSDLPEEDPDASTDQP